MLMNVVPKAIVLTFAVWLLGSATDALAQQDGSIVVAPGDTEGVNGPPSVGIGASHPGQTGHPGQIGGPGGSTDHGGGPQAPACTSTPIPGANVGTDPSNPTWNNCSGTASGTITGPAGPAAGPTPVQLAEQAYQQMRMPLPVPKHSPDLRLPDGRSATVVGEHTWIWTDPSSWIEQSKRVTAGAVWAEVRAVPIRLSFDAGISAPVSCPGPGTPYDRKYGLHAASPDCDSVFTKSSYGQPGDEVTAAYGITWRVTWTGSTGAAPASGTLPNMTSRASATFAVAEAQALIH
jgi:hypothetical protein